ncbi:MAG: hypothetical protein WC479_02015 [Candidatus Izemoplasmatales bacterium]|jgi:hypothetical protein
MKKIMIIVMLLLSGITLIGCEEVTTAVTTADGTVIVDPAIYPIANAADLSTIEMNKNYILTADIDLDGVEWVPLGNSMTPYLGTFDGDGYTISNFQITQSRNFNGLFGYAFGDIIDLSVTDFVIEYATDIVTYAAGLVAYTSGDITNCHVDGSINVDNTVTNIFAGLLAGFVTSYITNATTAVDFVETTITSCSALGTITVIADDFIYVGGLIGQIYNVAIDRCFAETTINAGSRTYRVYAGGLLGYNYGGILYGHEEEIERSTDIAIKNSYAITTIAVSSLGTTVTVGGLIGYSHSGLIENDYAIATITAIGPVVNAGGIIGENWTGTLVNVVTKITFTLTPSGNQETNWSAIAGFQDGRSVINNAYHLTTLVTPMTSETGSPITITSLANVNWYHDTLNWDETQTDISKAVANFTH